MIGLFFFKMTQVSRIPLPKEKLDKIYHLFFDFIASANKESAVEAVLTEIITPTEKIMLAKRVACFYLIAKNIGLVEISRALKLSLSTVHYFKFLYDNKPAIKTFLKGKIAQEKVVNLLEDLLVEFFYGISRKGVSWDQQKQEYFKHRQKRAEPI